MVGRRSIELCQRVINRAARVAKRYYRMTPLTPPAPKRPYYVPPERHTNGVINTLRGIVEALGDAAPKLGTGAVVRRPSDETMKQIKKPISKG